MSVTTPPCPICFENKPLLTVCASSHVTCSDCMREYLKKTVSSIHPKPICYAFQCNAPLEASLVEAVFAGEPEELKRLEYLSEKEMRDRDPRWRPCPRSNCYGGGNIGIEKSVECGDCKLLFCKDCAREMSSHDEGICKNAIPLNDEQTKPCPACKIPIYRYTGCPHMVCQWCKFEFCFLCSQSYYVGHMKDVHWEPFVQQNIPFSPVHIFHRREPPMFGIGNVMESVQYQERIIQPHLKVTVSEMRTLHRQRIDISLVDSTGRIVVDAITKSKKKLIVGSDFLIFPNLRLQKRSYICERKAPESDDNFRVRIDAAGQTLYTNSFTVAKKRKVNLDESNKRNVKHKK